MIIIIFSHIFMQIIILYLTLIAQKISQLTIYSASSISFLMTLKNNNNNLMMSISSYKNFINLAKSKI